MSHLTITPFFMDGIGFMSQMDNLGGMSFMSLMDNKRKCANNSSCLLVDKIRPHQTR